MSRRKQARPIRLLEDEETSTIPVTTSVGPVIDNTSAIDNSHASIKSEEMVVNNTLTCPRCQDQFDEVQEFMEHSSICAIKSEVAENQSDSEDMVVSEIDDDDEEVSGKNLELVRRHRQDTENNNSINGSPAEEVEGSRLNFPFPTPAAAGHVTLEALQNTKVAVAQFAATTMANNSDNETALQDLAVLQSTLFTLQHQQVFQLQLINQLQQQLSLNRVKVTTSTSPSPKPEEMKRSPTPAESPPIQQLLPRTSEPTSPVSLPPPSVNQEPIRQPSPTPPLEPPGIEVSVPSSVPPQLQQPMCSISSSLASTIITHNNEPPPSLDEPNTLEMLQKRAQEVLDNASQGLLANNLADDIAFRRKDSLSYDKGRNEPFFKHRCRYCGKVFGSDSALQIHIRSHTGERPFKCNVCGSRFTTKGNLKVHFQRHASKFPHVKMNPNPVPEHLDKYHPPLLAQLGQQSALSPGGPPHHPPPGFPGVPPFPSTSLPIYRPTAPPPELINNRLQPSPHRPPENALRIFASHPLFLNREEQDTPENLSKPLRSPTPVQNMQENQQRRSQSPTENMREMKIDSKLNDEDLKPKQEMETDEPEHEQERYPSPPPFDESSEDSKFSNEEVLERQSLENDHNENMQDEPENLSNKSNSVSVPLSIATGQKLPSNFLFANQSSPPSSASSGSLGPFPHNFDPAKDPAIYTNLLPRPGSNDNSWESLIEITKTSETTKLQQLVDNIENKLTDPNQCVICHRVLSCKSALQMHYRTHTGERPFKCKICGRAFTTKGNLKTHMGVHRAKPPMRVLHQCPVCHKKFTNALVLQQHIRLHTGEPTDLTPEQIQAAEVKDLPSPGSFTSLSNSMNTFFSQNIPLPGLSPLGPGGLPFHLNRYGSESDIKSEQDYSETRGDDDDADDDDISSTDPQNFSASPGAPENHLASSAISHMSTSSFVNFSAEDLCARNMTTSPSIQNGDKSPDPSGITSPGSSEVRSPTHRSTPVQIPRPPSNQPPNSPAPSETNSSGALDLTPRSSQPPMSSPGPPVPTQTSLFSNFALLPPGQPTTPLFSSAISSLTSTVLTSTPFSPLGLVNPAGRGNTTCNICFKTFACNSALEIHYRSHTKERPFKCTVCDRGFSTKDYFQGNMKQHMLTHKIRDMPQHMFDKPPSQHTPEEQQIPAREPSLPPPPAIPPQHEPEKPPPPIPPQEPSPDHLSKRAPTETEMPLPKRPPSLQNSKHLCHVCNKNFSSSSALQIHMRTHTGDKPFRCTVCQKAFTTKGNLKVHMGTHMWSNGASRRGRRMSLDLPPIPMTPKDSEFLQRRPDLFYPYLPAPFLNGIHHKPMNELNPLQSPQNGLANAGKYSGLLGFGYPPPQVLRSQGGSPERPESRPPSREQERLWDLHFDRKAAPDGGRDELLPPNREGLAA